MELFQSLICWYGYDNRKRFSIISLVSYFIFILASVAFSQMLTLSFIILFALIGGNLFTTKRRLNDAGLKKNWLILPATAFFISTCIIILTSSAVFYWLLLFPLVVSALLLTYPSDQQRSYIMGYHGPINLNKYHTESTSKNNRIEPSLYASSVQQEDLTISSNSTESFENNIPNSINDKQDIGELIRLSLLSHQNALISLAGVASVVIVAIVISLIISNKNSHEKGGVASTPVENKSTILNIAKHNPISLPDNFTLMLSDFNGLIIHWTGDENNTETSLWSQSSVMGESSCKLISFNKGNSIRTLEVTIENKTNYYAYFSPLDTKELVRAIAYQSNFTLCEYEFSLKGSQSVVGKNDTYSEYLAN